MAKYRVWARAYYYIDVEAESEEEAMEIAENSDGGDFDAAPGWEMEKVNLIEEKFWEVDLRSRKTGDTIETIFLGEWHEEAMDCLNRWYDEHPELDREYPREQYVDGNDGVFADIYLTSNPHGVGKW